MVDQTRHGQEQPSDSLVVIGNFDGVHRGHQAVLSAAVRLARQRGLVPWVLTFDPHPASVLRPEAYVALTSTRRKVELFARVDPSLRVLVEPFDRKLAAKTPAQFVSELLLDRLRAKLVLVGQNFRFGRKRSGDLAELRRLGERFGFEAQVVPLSGDDAGAYSSTRVRDALQRHDLALVQRILGRPHSFGGVVQRGDGRGSSLGIPTANLAEILEALPPNGVYACVVDREDGSDAGMLGQGVLNVGVRPTFSAGASVEVHLLDFEDDLYEARLRLHLIGHLRDERRFENSQQLKQQIQDDISAARSVLRSVDADPKAAPHWF